MYVYICVCICIYIYIHIYIYIYILYDTLVTLGEHRNQKYLNSVTTFSPVFTHCPFCISSPPNYKKGKDFYFSNFEKEKCFHFFKL